MLAERAGWIETAGGSHLGCSLDAIVVTSDKLRLADHLIASGIATPRTLRYDPCDGGSYPGPFPAIVKPIDGAGSESTFVVADRDGFAAIPSSAGEWIIQEQRPGQSMSASFIVGRNAGGVPLGDG